MIDVAKMREAYLAELPTYRRLAKSVENSLKSAAQACGLHHVEVVSRAKDVRSFLRKALSKGYADPIAEVTDKAGVRAIIAFPQEEGPVEELIASRFTVIERTDKRATLAAHEVGYMGLHLLVKPRRGRMTDKICEIQVRTRAEDLWARLSHEVLYKTPDVLGAAERRKVLRLSAVLDVFDAEADRTWTGFLQSSDYIVGRAVNALESSLFKLAGRYDGDDLTAEILTRVLLPRYSQDEVLHVEPLITEFVSARFEKLQDIYSRYKTDDRHLLLHRPEALMIFSQLEDDPFALVGRWVQHLPFSELRALADVWGTSVEEPA